MRAPLVRSRTARTPRVRLSARRFAPPLLAAGVLTLWWTAARPDAATSTGALVLLGLWGLGLVPLHVAPERPPRPDGPPAPPPPEHPPYVPLPPVPDPGAPWQRGHQ
ncbi:hypothetical protein FNX44_002820 [Streptomyces sp. OF1]|uniref:Uncharacterized protein n=1 Tax=Streptomyces alkaliterrae TaxID=2213162 RepID=A0A5P0YKK1_9ACTN|nr:hypothetical protein [Streptomyces alkaliterrae]